MRTLLIIQGHSGAGKSTVSKMFAKKHGWALIESDYFFFGMNPQEEHPKSDYAVTFDNILDTARNFMEAGKDLIVSGALVAVEASDPVDIEKLAQLAKKHGYDVRRFIFTVDRDVSMERMKKRGHVVPEWAYNAIVKEIERTRSKDAVMIDTSHLSPEQVLEKLEEEVLRD